MEAICKELSDGLSEVNKHIESIEEWCRVISDAERGANYGRRPVVPQAAISLIFEKRPALIVLYHALSKPEDRGIFDGIGEGILEKTQDEKLVWLIQDKLSYYNFGTDVDALRKLWGTTGPDVSAYLDYSLQEFLELAAKKRVSVNDKTVITTGLQFVNIKNKLALFDADWSGVDLNRRVVCEAKEQGLALQSYKELAQDGEPIGLERALVVFKDGETRYREVQAFLSRIFESVKEGINYQGIIAVRRRVDAKVLEVLLERDAGPVILEGWGATFTRRFKGEVQQDQFSGPFIEQARRVEQRLDNLEYMTDLFDDKGEFIEGKGFVREMIKDLERRAHADLLIKDKSYLQESFFWGAAEYVIVKLRHNISDIGRVVERVFKKTTQDAYHFVYSVLRWPYMEHVATNVSPMGYKFDRDCQRALRRVWENILTREARQRLRFYWGMFIFGIVMFFWCLVIDSIGMFLTAPLLLISVHEWGVAKALESTSLQKFPTEPDEQTENETVEAISRQMYEEWGNQYPGLKIKTADSKTQKGWVNWLQNHVFGVQKTS